MSTQVSVLMPVYNCGPYLDEAIESIRRQTFADFEFVIVNDGSTDNSLEIIQRHAAEDERIVVVDRSNGGIVVALNAGLEVCQGELIARMDGDDVSPLDRFEIQVKAIRENPNWAVVGGNAQRIDVTGAPCGMATYPQEHEAIDAHGMSSSWPGVLQGSAIFRASALLQIGGFRDRYRYAEDLDLFLRLAEVAELRNVQNVLLQYRQHPQSVSGSRLAWQTRSAVEAIADARRRRKLRGHGNLHRFCHRASWCSGDEGRPLLAMHYAVRAWRYAPFSSLGPRALARAIWRAAVPLKKS